MGLSRYDQEHKVFWHRPEISWLKFEIPNAVLEQPEVVATWACLVWSHWDAINHHHNAIFCRMEVNFRVSLLVLWSKISFCICLISYIFTTALLLNSEAHLQLCCPASQQMSPGWTLLHAVSCLAHPTHTYAGLLAQSHVQHPTHFWRHSFSLSHTHTLRASHLFPLLSSFSHFFKMLTVNCLRQLKPETFWKETYWKRNTWEEKKLVVIFVVSLLHEASYVVTDLYKDTSNRKNLMEEILNPM